MADNEQLIGLNRSEHPDSEDFSRALEKAKFGDSSGFAFIYGQFNQPVWAVVCSEGSPDPDDTVNSVFLKAFRSIDRFVGNESNFASYLYQIAHFQCIDERRARNRQVQLLASEQSSETTDSTSGLDPTLSSTALRIHEALHSLTPQQREVVVLRVLFGLTGPDTAYALERQIAEVRTLQNRAEARLRIFVGTRAVKI